MRKVWRRDLLHTTAFRMSMGYTFLVTLAVGVTLGSTYLLTQSIIRGNTDLIIDTELDSLENQYVRRGIPGVTDVNFELVWDPPWNTGMMSEEAKLQLGMM